MQWIRKYTQSPAALDFQRAVNTMVKGEGYRSWAGLNFEGPELRSVKFYYTWYRIPENREIVRLLGPLRAEEYSNELSRAATDYIFRRQDAGSGFTFVLKLDSGLNPVTGFYMKQRFGGEDAFWDLPETQLFLTSGADGSGTDDVKNKGVFYQPDGRREEKSYYYFSDLRYKNIIADLFKDPELATAPVIEYALGPGHRSGSDDPLARRKAIVFGDFQRLSDHYLGQWKDLGNYVADIREKGYQIYCPGIYGDGKCRSLYIFNFSEKGFLNEKMIRTS